MRRFRIMLLATAALLLLGGLTAASADELLLRVDGDEATRVGLRAQVDMLWDLSACSIAKGDAADVGALEGLGLSVEVLDKDPSAKSYYAAYTKRGDSAAALSVLGDVLTVDGAATLVRMGAEEASLAAGLGMDLARIFMDPMVPMKDAAARESGIMAVHPEIVDMVDAVSQPNLEAIATQLSTAYTSRQSNTAGGFASATWIHDQLVSYGIADVAYHDFDANADNVVATLPGAVFPENIIVFGGHYDSTSYFGDAPGADDNASGTMAVMEAARILNGYTFENTIQFVTFASEEFGLFGSNAFAREASQRGDNILAMLNVDMIGYLASGDTPDVDIIAGSSSAAVREIAFWAIDQYVGFPAIVGTGVIGGTSDHASFTSYGYPAIWFFEDVAQDSPYIHSANDTIGQSLNDFGFATNCTKSIVATLAALAEPVDDVAIGHTPLDDTDDTTNPYPVVALVVSTEPLAAGNPVLNYAIDGGGYTAVVMTATGNPNEYEAEIPAQALGTTVEYYIEAEDVLGASDTSPPSAPDVVHSFNVEEASSGWLLADVEASTMKGNGSSDWAVIQFLAMALLPAAVVLFWRRRVR